MLFTEAQFLIALTFALFAFFFILGYESEKKSGGFFMMFAGFTFLAFDGLVITLLDALAMSLMSPIGVFIIVLGIMKAFYTEEKKGDG